MVEAYVDASWYILQTLAKHGSLKANQIKTLTKEIGSRTTLYDALDLLLHDKMITVDEKKVYSLNASEYQQQIRALKNYEDYSNLSDNASKIFTNLEKLIRNHKMVLNDTDADVKIAREALKSKPYLNLINNTVKIFQLGAMMEFVINAGMLSKTIEKRAISLRSKNQKISTKYLETLLKVEPVLWREVLMLIQTKLASKIDPL